MESINHERPHEALDMRRPPMSTNPPFGPIAASENSNTPSTIAWCWLPAAGEFATLRKKINLSTSLAGQAVGIKEVDDGMWLVTFRNYDLGYIDLEEKTLQPLKQPFGPRL
jgi:hypothetical protein